MKQNLIEDVCKGGDLLKYYYYYYYYYYYRDCRQQVTFFHAQTVKGAKSNVVTRKLLA